MSGPASPAAATAAYATRHAARCAPGPWRTLAGLTVSSIGLGTDLGECDAGDDERYEAAALACLAGGVNLLDTAINDRCQRSERALGRALRRAVQQGVVARDEVVVCTKGGHTPFDGVPPRSSREYIEYVRQHFLAPGSCRPEDLVGGNHCLAPGFLRAQVERSRANLGVQRIDVYDLHNPETQLRSVDRAAFLACIRAAFELLESLCDAGWIGVYGTATWDGYRVLPEAREHLSLRTLVALAREVGGEAHRFRAVQVPYNVVMPEAALAETQEGAPDEGAAPTHQWGVPRPRRQPLLEAAADLGIAVVASATLMRSRLARTLPLELRSAFIDLRTDAQRALHFARSTPGVTAALVGMRDPAHVRDNLELVRVPPPVEAAKRLIGR
ncbi:MAG: aldo/keto reductase [bacterium]|jgi:aryl-alcohol dehydrogenase-like predicted oxidoreductase|nr:MAG: aldo/keto reductase [bacterium]